MPYTLVSSAELAAKREKRLEQRTRRERRKCVSPAQQRANARRNAVSRKLHQLMKVRRHAGLDPYVANQLRLYFSKNVYEGNKVPLKKLIKQDPRLEGVLKEVGYEAEEVGTEGVEEAQEGHEGEGMVGVEEEECRVGKRIGKGRKRGRGKKRGEVEVVGTSTAGLNTLEEGEEEEQERERGEEGRREYVESIGDVGYGQVPARVW